jgi:hypothetical protein
MEDFRLDLTPLQACLLQSALHHVGSDRKRMDVQLTDGILRIFVSKEGEMVSLKFINGKLNKR